jgi:ABC-type dipeptide/oligopeptide/nickel transport system permease component
MTGNRFLTLLYAFSIGWVGIWMPCKALASLWGFWSFAGFWNEIIPLCFLAALSLGLLVRLFRSLI